METRAQKQVGTSQSASDLGIVILGAKAGGGYAAFPMSADGLSLQTTSSVPGTLESGTDVTGQDTYATVLTPSEAKTHIMITNEGANAAIVSLDAGVTNTISKVPGGFVMVVDSISVTTAAIQAKNFSAGQNYTNLTISVW
jgi:hypothetical protein